MTTNDLRHLTPIVTDEFFNGDSGDRDKLEEEGEEEFVVDEGELDIVPNKATALTGVNSPDLDPVEEQLLPLHPPGNSSDLQLHSPIVQEVQDSFSPDPRTDNDNAQQVNETITGKVDPKQKQEQRRDRRTPPRIGTKGYKRPQLRPIPEEHSPSPHPQLRPRKH